MTVRPGSASISVADTESHQPEVYPLLITASTYPFLNVLWDILHHLLLVPLYLAGDHLFHGLFRRRDIGGWAKAAWVFLIVIIPWFGVLIYLIANHDGMAERNEKQVTAAHAQFDQAVREAAAKGGPARWRSRPPRSSGRWHDHPGGVRRDKGQGARGDLLRTTPGLVDEADRCRTAVGHGSVPVRVTP